ncbi:cytochrome P460 family protein [Variovorax sp. YR752]|uniref:cytochrome P460 family protein n=1 Tax=Variovorax sp. YR752 TaxID=1884383 RepID=UPI003137EBCB
MVRSLIAPLAIAGLAALAAGCATSPRPLNDGEIAVPADYKSWPKFLSAIQRPDAKQVREIYMNPAAASATSAGGFGNGTVFVMENYAALETTDGKLATGSDGKLIKADLLRVFVMGKGAGWGQAAPEPLRNGNWVYASYLADGRTKGPDDLATCRACHLPVANKDFVHRYDEHFNGRK